MTTLVAWSSVDGKGSPSAVHLCSDSRYTWDEHGKLRCDSGRKIFFSTKQPDLFAYAGNVGIPDSVFGQICRDIDESHSFRFDSRADLRMERYKAALDRAHAVQPFDPRTSIIYATRDGEGIDARFYAWVIKYEVQEVGGIERLLEINQSESDIIEILGTGGRPLRDIYAQKKRSPQGGSSRAVFWSLLDSLRSGTDSRSGGPPQAACLNRTDAAKPVGFKYNDLYYVLGRSVNPEEIARMEEAGSAEFRNEHFEFISPITGEPRSNAQRYREGKRR